MDAAQVVVVGSYNQDCVWRVEHVPEAGETLRGRDFASAHGGKGFNQAVACVRQGVATAFIAACGDDVAGAAAQRVAADQGLVACWQVRADATTGNACILVEASGQNRIIVALGANERLDPAFLRAQERAFAGARVLLAQLENNIEATREAFALATRHGLTRLLNPAPVHPALDAALFAQVDILTPNETEFALLLERLTGQRIDAATLARSDDATLHALARQLGAPTLVITLGAHGCFVSHSEGERRGDATSHYRVGAEAADTIDTTGAGDAFSGALAAGLLRFAGRPFREVVAHANRCAALSTEKRGASAAMPRFDDIAARYAPSCA